MTLQSTLEARVKALEFTEETFTMNKIDIKEIMLDALSLHPLSYTELMWILLEHLIEHIEDNFTKETEESTMQELIGG